MSSLFRGELNPVASKAQKKVQVPEGYGCLTLYSIYFIYLCHCIIFLCGFQKLAGLSSPDLKEVVMLLKSSQLPCFLPAALIIVTSSLLFVKSLKIFLFSVYFQYFFQQILVEVSKFVSPGHDTYTYGPFTPTKHV